MPHRTNIIKKYIKSNSIGLEIGVWKGDFSDLVLSLKSLNKYYLLDPWQLQTNYENRWYGGSHPKFRSINMDEIYSSVVKRFANYNEITIIRDYSENAKKYIQDNELDWIYIDGNHSYQYVLKDLLIARDLVKPGGWILCDDYGWNDGDGGPKKAIDEFCKKYKTKLIINNTQAIFENQK